MSSTRFVIPKINLLDENVFNNRDEIFLLISLIKKQPLGNG